MTPAELESIRERDAKVPVDYRPRCGTHAHADRRLLLAHIGALQDENFMLDETCKRLGAELDQLKR